MKRLFLVYLILHFSSASTFSQDLRSDTFDIRSCRLDLDLSDFAGRILYGQATLSIQSKMNGMNGIHLDLLKLTVDSVMVDNYYVPFSHNDTLLYVPFAAPFNADDSFTVRVVYHGRPLQPTGDFGGFYWNSTYAFNIGVSFLSNPHNYGRVWFPCFDNFRERSLFEFYVTTRANHKAFCNGMLLNEATIGNKKVWHWKLTQEIPSYLASVAVSDYQTLMDTVQGMGGVKEIYLAARAVDTTALKNLFVHLPDAFHIQENLWGEYKWDRVGYCIVPFTAGAMEHATNIAFMQYYLNVLADDCESTMAHELSHHWFGNLITCDSASEMWINEGWAVYNEMLFYENFYGKESYTRNVRSNHEDVLHNAHVNDNAYLPVSGVPTENTYGSTVYKKGSDVIHSLRYYMGDSMFFRCVKDFLEEFSFKHVSTAQLRDYLSTCSGNNLNEYFNNWIYAPGFPHFSIDRVVPHDVQSGPDIFRLYEVIIRQRLHQAPQFYTNVPIQVTAITEAGSGWQRMDTTVRISGECVSFTLPHSFDELLYVALDFDENLQDAVTDEWKIISDTGTFDFGTAKMQVLVNANSDSSLIRVEHNWIRPEPMKTKIPGLHLHDKRYWTVDGIFHPNLAAGARVLFDGTDVSLDASFLSNQEDSLVMMYRANADSEWVFSASFFIDKQNNANDKKGEVIIHNLQKGQYCLAIWNAAVPDTTTSESECTFLSVNELLHASNDFLLFPNPSEELVTLQFEKNNYDSVQLFDLSGRKLTEIRVAPEQSSLSLSMKGFAAGTYIVTLLGKDSRKISKKIVKQ